MIRSSTRPLVEDCHRLTIQPEYLRDSVPTPHGTSRTIQLSCNGRPFTVRFVFTPQHFGGQRAWIECPGVGCHRRCRYLLSPNAYSQPFACRKCWQTRYCSDYPRAACFHQFGQFLRGEMFADLAPWEALIARRRVGVRRGRRVGLRALRLMTRLLRQARGPLFVDTYLRLRH
jgi:hypothetical protein